MKKIMYVVSEDSFFISHRIEHAKDAIKNGYKVYLLTTLTGTNFFFRKQKINIINYKFNRSSKNPFSFLLLTLNLFIIYRKYKPDILHHVSIKIILAGSIAGILNKTPKIINAISGFGHLFISKNFFNAFLSFLILKCLRAMLFFKNIFFIVQNNEDYNTLIYKNKKFLNKIYLIYGSGVNLIKFKPLYKPVSKIPVILLASRLIYDKGIVEFVKASTIVNKKKILARFVLVGDFDKENPTAIPFQIIKSWVNQGIIEWWGHKKNMNAIFNQADIVCLPSYREGLSKTLIEAAACAKPLIAFNVPGCKEVIDNGINGYLAKPFSAVSLANKLINLLSSRKKIHEFGLRSRQIAVTRFNIKNISEDILRTYY